MAGYKPTMPFNVPMRLMAPNYDKKLGVAGKTFPDVQDCPLFYGSFRTFGGTERISNDVLTIETTGVIDTWYRPDIKADCRVYLCDTDEYFDIISRPEDIGMRHQHLQFKVRQVGGRP